MRTACCPFKRQGRRCQRRSGHRWFHLRFGLLRIDAWHHEDRSGEVDDSPCDRCGLTYQSAGLVWSAPSDLWNHVVGGRPDREAAGMLCPNCFLAAASDAGFLGPWWVTHRSDNDTSAVTQHGPDSVVPGSYRRGES